MSGGASAELIQSLFQLVVLSIVLERGLSFLFEIRLAPPPAFAKPGPGTDAERQYPMISEVLGSAFKSILTYAAAFGLCFAFRFDVFRALFADKTGDGSLLDIFLTAAVVSGGSAGSIKLFQDVLGLSKTARDAARDAREEEAKARLAKAQSDRAISELSLEQTGRQRELMKATQQDVSAGGPSGAKSGTPSFTPSQPWNLRPAPPPADVQPLPEILGSL